MKTIKTDNGEFKVYGSSDNLSEDEIKNNNKKGNILGIIFLIWFFGSMIILMSCGSFENGPAIMLTTFGQYFIVFGLITTTQNLKSKTLPIILIMPIVGFVIAGCGLYLWFGGQTAGSNLTSIAPLLICLVFVYVGIAMVWSSHSQKKYLNENCTLPVTAKVVDIKESWSRSSKGRSRKVYSPVYQIPNPKNKTEYIQICNETYSNMLALEIDDTVEILVNPENPEEFIDKHGAKLGTFMSILGSIFIVIGLIVSYMILDNLHLLESIKPFIPTNLTH